MTKTWKQRDAESLALWETIRAERAAQRRTVSQPALAVQLDVYGVPLCRGHEDGCKGVPPDDTQRTTDKCSIDRLSMFASEDATYLRQLESICAAHGVVNPWSEANRLAVSVVLGDASLVAYNQHAGTGEPEKKEPHEYTAWLVANSGRNQGHYRPAEFRREVYAAPVYAPSTSTSRERVLYSGMVRMVEDEQGSTYKPEFVNVIEEPFTAAAEWLHATEANRSAASTGRREIPFDRHSPQPTQLTAADAVQIDDGNHTRHTQRGGSLSAQMRKLNTAHVAFTNALKAFDELKRTPLAKEAATAVQQKQRELDSATWEFERTLEDYVFSSFYAQNTTYIKCNGTNAVDVESAAGEVYRRCHERLVNERLDIRADKVPTYVQGILKDERISFRHDNARASQKDEDIKAASITECTEAIDTADTRHHPEMFVRASAVRDNTRNFDSVTQGEHEEIARELAYEAALRKTPEPTEADNREQVGLEQPTKRKSFNAAKQAKQRDALDGLKDSLTPMQRLIVDLYTDGMTTAHIPGALDAVIDRLDSAEGWEIEYGAEVFTHEADAFKLTRAEAEELQTQAGKAALVKRSITELRALDKDEQLVTDLAAQWQATKAAREEAKEQQSKARVAAYWAAYWKQEGETEL